MAGLNNENGRSSQLSAEVSDKIVRRCDKELRPLAASGLGGCRMPLWRDRIGSVGVMGYLLPSPAQCC